MVACPRSAKYPKVYLLFVILLGSEGTILVRSDSSFFDFYTLKISSSISFLSLSSREFLNSLNLLNWRMKF